MHHRTSIELYANGTSEHINHRGFSDVKELLPFSLFLFTMDGVTSKHVTRFTNNNLVHRCSHQKQTARSGTALEKNVKGHGLKAPDCRNQKPIRGAKKRGSTFIPQGHYWSAQVFKKRSWRFLWETELASLLRGRDAGEDKTT